MTLKIKKFSLCPFLLLLVALLQVGRASCFPYYFKSFKVENGLSNNSVTCITQDKMGFMWIGTKDGLNRFDGYTFKIFRSSLSNAQSLQNNYIRAIHEDSRGLLWVGTDRGLYQYTPQNESFCAIPATTTKNIQAIKEDAKGNLWILSNWSLFKINRLTDQLTPVAPGNLRRVFSIEKDASGHIWAGNFDGHLFQFNADGRVLKTIDLYKHSKPSSNPIIASLHVTANGQIIAGTPDKGVKIVELKTGQYSDLEIPDAKHKNLYIRSVIKAADNELWLGSEFGIFVYNLQSGTFQQITKDYHDAYALKDNAVYSLYEDKEKGIWIGTYLGGLNYLPRQQILFKKYYPRSSANSLTGNVIRAMVKDSSDNLWIATEDAGIEKLDLRTDRFTNYTTGPNELSFSNIQSLFLLGKDLWAGTFYHGLDVMDTRTWRIKRRFKSKTGSGFSHDLVSGIFRVMKDSILVTTPRGVFRFHALKGTFAPFAGFPKGIWMSSIYEDHQGVLWAGSFGQGIFYFDPRSGQRGNLRHSPGNFKSLSHDRVNSIFEDSEQQLWLATNDRLNHLNRDTKSFERFGTAHGFRGELMLNILEDAHKRLWISTTNGLSCFDLSTHRAINYTVDDGLLNNQFNYNSSFKDADGCMYFGSTEGLIRFHPDKTLKKLDVPLVLLTGLFINGADHSSGNNEILNRAITYTSAIRLHNDQSTFSIEFASLNFNSSNILNYEYRMDGLSKNWISLRSDRRAELIGVPPGKYRFQVRATRNDGSQSKITTLGITILPPWWASKLAYSVYVFSGLIIIYLIIKVTNDRIREKNNRRIELIQISNEKEKLQNELIKEKEMLEEKITFFTNIAHEIKTPLTLIKIPLAKILKKASDIPHIQRNLMTMSRNTNRLIELTHQLLDFRKLEIKKFRIALSLVNISELLSQVADSFSYLIEERELNMTQVRPGKDLVASIDIDSFKTIIYNLMHNAIKYAESEIIVCLELSSEQEQKFTVKIKNDGPTIPAEFNEKIFEPFFRIDETRKETGSGIGLSLARSLAELHNGRLALETDNAGMNIFSLTLPM